MGTYLNPGNEGFGAIVASGYVDKTGLAGLVNSTIGTTRNLTCVSRPRRFGKSYAAQMLCAYYDRSCDSRALFDGLAISSDPSFEEHLNSYDVIYVDMTYLKQFCDGYATLVKYLPRRLKEELAEAYPDVRESDELPEAMVRVAEHTGRKFIMIIDEWDAPIRENVAVEEEYLHFLRSLFKSSLTTARIFAAAYMTGILPIKKDGSQSAISDFREYTMVKPRMFAPYVGFVEAEVRGLCRENGVEFCEMRRWYDGYELSGVGSVYNPNSVMKAIEYADFDSYWSQTSAARGLMDYIALDYDGLARTVAELVGGASVAVETLGFANDLTTFRSKDDVLTLLVHLGYLAYDSEVGTARIPNEEIRLEFQRAIHGVGYGETARRVRESEQLFLDTMAGDEDAVARQIEKVHAEETSPLHYNREDSLRSVIKLAYYTYRDHYLQWEELPAGVGYADIVYLPRRGSGWPALVVELKWNEPAEGAVAQILHKGYADALAGYCGEVLLVGISYDKDAPTGERRHHCKIVALRQG